MTKELVILLDKLKVKKYGVYSTFLCSHSTGGRPRARQNDNTVPRTCHSYKETTEEDDERNISYGPKGVLMLPTGRSHRKGMYRRRNGGSQYCFCVEERPVLIGPFV